MQEAIRILTGNERQKLRSATHWNILRHMLEGAPNGFLILVLWELFKPQQDISTQKLIWILISMAALLVLNIFLAMYAYTKSYQMGALLSADARLRLGEHLRKLSMGFYKTRDPGDITALLLQDMTKVEQIFSHIYSDMIAVIVTPAVTILFLLFIDWRMALAIVATAPLAIPVLILCQKIGIHFGKKLAAAGNDSISCMLEYLQGIQVIKAFNLTGNKFKRLNNSLKNLRDQNIRTEAVVGPLIIGYTVMLELSFVIVLLLGTYLLFQGSLTVAVFLIFLVIGYALLRPMQAVATFIAELRYMTIAADRITNVLDTKPLPEPAETTALQSFDIEFKNVTFGYHQEDVLKEVSFNAPAHSVTALVGPSGSGKTTIASLIARFWDINSGEILVGGRNVKDLTTENLLASVTMVFQDVYLFHDTIYNNIKVGRADAVREEIIAAAKDAHCHEFIEKLSGGYDTLIGEGGSTLSGGEKQRISIARAILKDAPIVLLDEATASLDPENELLIRQAISKLVQSKTLIIIAHRLSTIADAGRILVLDKGRIVERGRHEELITVDGLYSRLWAEQMRARGWKFGSKRKERKTGVDV